VSKKVRQTVPTIEVAAEPARVPTVWVVTPVFLDVEAFLVVRDQALRFLRQIPALATSPVTFVAVDDTAGMDPQVERIEAQPGALVVRPPFNLGHQRAIVYALRTLASRIAEEDVVVTLDADGEDRPEDLPRLLEVLLAPGAKPRRVVLARRTKREESLRFKVLYAGFKLLSRASTGTVIHSGNFAAYRGWVVHNVLGHPSFDLCYSSSLVTIDLDRHYVPCARGSRYAGRSRMTLLKLLIHGLRMWMPFLDRIAVRALVFFTFVFALTCTWAVGLLGVRLLTDRAVPAWSVYGLMTMILVSFVALGNALVLFAVFAQSQGVLLRGMERLSRDPARDTPDRAD
jgi:hypothetical protein